VRRAEAGTGEQMAIGTGLRRFAALFVITLLGIPRVAASGEVSAASPVSPVVLTEYAPLKTHDRGPTKAEGVIYFIDGLDSTERLPDDFIATYPYLYDLNNKSGWDVVSAKYPNSESDIANSVSRSVPYVFSRVQSLKRQGYKKVVLAGQSWGGWVAMEVATLDAQTKLVDVLMTVAPAAYGSRVWKGVDNPYYLQNLTEYVRAIKAVRTPTVAIFFSGDEFDPGNRGDIADAFLARNKVPLLLIDRPEGFSGHGAGWLPSFADQYGTCIADFLKALRGSRCDIDQATARRSMRTPVESEIVMREGRLSVGYEQLAGKTFIITSPAIQVRVLTFAAGNSDVATADHALDDDYIHNTDEACTGQQCYRVYEVPGRRYIAFNRDGTFAGWLAPV
jgi:pimeloyl-ACP methyl ester carboxylesterase